MFSNFNKSNNKVLISGISTSDLKVLTSEEMTDLFKKMKNGDSFARNDLINGNLKLVLSILRKVNSKNENLDDLFQVGCIGLVKAIDNFDLSHEVKFSTYAVPMILGEIKRYLRDNNTIRVSRSTRDLAYKALKLKEEYFMEKGEEISIEDLATALDVTTYDLVFALESLKDPVSMFEPIYNDGGDTIYVYDQIEDKRRTGSVVEEKLATSDAINYLSDREQHILNERYIIGKTQMEIAKDMDISQAQVSRLEKNAIKQLKKTLR